jgi:Arc/MetJ-type ribon-helix-helix transcriptional regulator
MLGVIGVGNQLVGSEKMKTPSFRAHADLLDEFDEWVEASDYSGRSEAIREFMQDAIGGAPQSELTPLEPPAEETLADAYRRLCRASYPNGKVKASVAERVAIRNHPHNLGAEDAMPLVLRPLQNRGYLQRRSGHAGQCRPLVVWEIVGWE